MLSTFDIVLIGVSGYYFLTLIWFIVGTYKKQPLLTQKSTEGVSVIVSIFNGENALPKLISDLKNQQYSGDVEFILVDDGSTDNSAEIIKNQSINDSRFRYVNSDYGDAKLSLKKKGLDAGIKSSTFDILLFTDVDCHLQPNWIQGMVNNFTKDIDYVIGYSETRPLNKFVTIFQRIDFMMLMFSARSTTVFHHTWACSGQNQAYRKSLYNEVGGFADISTQLQGDDSLFLHLCRNKTKVNVRFSEYESTHVTSRPETSWISFLKQRIRWSGDASIMWKFNKIFFISITATFLTNSLLFIGLITFFSKVAVTCLFFKFILECFLFCRGGRYINSEVNIIQFLCWFVIQIPYIVAMGLMSSTANAFSWRGRKVG